MLYPEIHYEQHVDTFVINDIVLSIPPESIQIQKEDLQYQWKTLRSKVSTKSMSSHGQNIVSFNFAVKASRILELHRLLIELRNTPFCSVENLFLRETFVPTWDPSQKMAFSVIDCAIAPYPNSSDTFMVNIKMVWFNYFPYLHNWLYRREWRTEWIESQSGGNRIKQTIGWDIDEHADYLSHRYNIIDEEEFENEEEPVLIEEQVFGTLHDLLPLPGRMEASRWTSSARESLIYQRYINFLQRDALKKDFYIDIEQDFAGDSNKRIRDILFGVHRDSTDYEYVTGLHATLNASAYEFTEDEKRTFNAAQQRWIQKILSFRDILNFGFNIYQVVNIPPVLSNNYKKLVAQQGITLGAPGAGNWITNSLGTRKFGFRTEILNAAGFHSPFGDPQGNPYTFGKIPISRSFEWKVDNRYESTGATERLHRGTDMGWADITGETFFAVKAGTVTRIKDYISINNGVWKKVYLNNRNTEAKVSLTPDDIADLEDTLRRILLRRSRVELPDVLMDGDRLSTQALANDAVSNFVRFGLFIGSINRSNTYYVFDAGNASGRSLKIQHEDGSFSLYFHWKEIDPILYTANGKKVKAGQKLGVIGYAGPAKATGSIGVFKRHIQESDTTVDSIVLHSLLPEHLHFEYWEKRDIEPGRNPVNDNSIPEDELYLGYIAVNWIIPTMDYPDYTALPDGAEYTLAEVEDLPEDTEEEKQEKTDISDAITKITTLIEDGWHYYNETSDISNVWYKPVFFSVSKNNPDGLLEDKLMNQDLIYSNFVAGFKNIVATLPILDHEFPTHQFLGSTEPFYIFELYGLDKRVSADGITMQGEGIGTGAGMLETIRQTLLRNSAQYRRIPNSWTCRIDTFCTRLLGTTTAVDIRVNEDGDDDISDIKFMRRSSITRMDTQTIPESPGLLHITLETSETNTFDQEVLINQGLSKEDLDEALSLVLRKLYDLDFDFNKDLLRAFALASFLDKKFDIFSDEDLVLGSNVDNNVLILQNHNLTRSNASEDFLNTYKLLGGDADFFYLTDAPSDLNVRDRRPGSLETILISIEDDPLFTLAESGDVILNIDALRASLTDTELYRANELNFDLILRLGSVVRRIILTANLMIAEDQNLFTSKSNGLTGESLSTEEVRAALYDLPATPKYLRAVEQYMIDVSARSYWPSLSLAGLDPYQDWDPFAPVELTSEEKNDKIRTELSLNDNWLFFDPPEEGDEMSHLTHLVDLGYANDFFSPSNATSLNIGLVNLLNDTFLYPATNFVIESVISPLRNLQEALELIDGDTSDKAVVSTNAKAIATSAENQFKKMSQDYLLSLPMFEASAKDYFVNNAEDYLRWVFGDIFDLFTDGTSTFTSTAASLEETIKSGGYILGHPFGIDAAYYMPPQIIGEAFPEIPVPDSTDEVGSGIVDSVTGLFVVAPISRLLSAIAIKMGFTDLDTLLESAQLNISGSPFIWRIDKEHEMKKLHTFRQALARVGMEVLKNPQILRLFGLEEYEYHEVSDIVKGKEAYPDLNIPGHPFFGEKYSTYPDFYMWNMYEDGDIFNSEVRAHIESSMFHALENAYNSMQKMQKSDTKQRNDFGDKEEAKYDRTELLNLRFNAEGSDIGTIGINGRVGPTAFPFAPKEGDPSPGSFAGLSSLETANKQIAKAVVAGTQKPTDTTVGDIIQYDITSLNPTGIRVSNQENIFGARGGAFYPRKLSNAEYADLRTEFDKVQSGSMFGSKASYLKIKERNLSKIDRIDGLPIAAQVQASHSFDLDSLKLLARHSSHDLFSQKRRLAGAYPTFKLYFVEEDEHESRLLNFDDFYSYSGVRDFTVVMNRESPADHAVITLQNISGALDGTKRNTVVDADYFFDFKKSRADEPDVIGTNEEQAYGALILRPGLNVQLRCGNSNDPDLLEVLISGRIVDVQWNIGGDLAQITVQSFGAELTQILKNSGKNSADPKAYYTTHQLLGALMLEPELKHFGRWEFGKLFQIGQGNDARLDFYDYNRDAKGGFFYITNVVADTMLSHPYWLLAGSVLLALGQIVPVGKVGTTATKATQLTAKTTGWLRKLGVPIARLGRNQPWLKRVFENVNLADNLTDVDINTRISLRLVERLENRRWMRNIYNNGRKWVFRTGDDITDPGILRNLNKVVGEEAEIILSGKLAEFNRMLNLISGIDDPNNRAKRVLINTNVLESFLKAQDELAAVTNTDDAVRIIREFQQEANAWLFRGKWYSDPFAAAVPGAQPWMGIGGRPLVQFANSFVDGGKAIGIGLAAAAGTDVLADIFFSGTDRGPIDAIINYFKASQVTLFLSPQDDNLYAPHPKDYMIYGESTMDRFYRSVHNIVFGSVFSEDNVVGRWISGGDPFEKKAPISACGYVLKNTFIWDVLQEMTLRHPGWIAACRPYGTDFRYTMFFGVPSQRYWAFGMSNRFIDRSNRLYRILQDGVTKDKYRALYGSRLENGEHIDTLEENTGPLNNAAFTALQNSFTSRTLKEYLTGLSYRFVPFRKYHMISSENDIIENRLMSTENASYNAVDVSYYSRKPKKNDSAPEGSFLFKLHPFIPEHMLRVKPAPLYPNCRGIEMAARYAMGELMQCIQSMYRGEILTLGRARMRPHDVGILMDNYNDMVGPIIIDQVVHNFSYETGFITEIKPAAFTVANETSSWPVLEAMKMTALAIKNIEYDSYGTERLFEDALLGNPLDYVLNLSVGDAYNSYNDYLKRKLVDAIGEDFVKIDRNNGDISVISSLGEAPIDLGVPLETASTAVNAIPKVASLSLAIPFGAYGLAFGVYYNSNLPNALPDFPSLVNLVGGYSLFLQCLKGDAIQVVPLIKNGHPMIANMTVQDPAVLWSNFKGSLARVVDDYVDGTRDLLTLWRTYGSYLWRIPEFQYTANIDPNSIDLTGQGNAPTGNVGDLGLFITGNSNG